MAWSINRVANNLLRSGARWNSRMGESATVKYSFPTSILGGDWGEGRGYSSFSEAQQTAAEQSLAKWSEVAGISFQESTTNDGKDGSIRLSNTTTGPQVAWAYYPSSGTGGDVWINPNYWSNKTLTEGSYGLHTMVHELGHSLGLSHPGNYNGTIDYSKRRYSQDSRKYTVMSYFAHPNDYYAYAPGPLMHDIYAIQKAYGVNWETRKTDTVYSWGENAKFVQSLWDAGGEDTIDASSQNSRVVVDLRASKFSSVGLNSRGSLASNNLSIAYGAVIENVKGGAGNDTLRGNAWNNHIIGNGGDDLLVSFFGNDLLEGGSGADEYRLIRTFGNDVVSDSGGATKIRFNNSLYDKVNGYRQDNDLYLSTTDMASTVKVTNYFLASERYTFQARKRVGSVNRIRNFTMQYDDIGNTPGGAATLAMGASATSSIDYRNDHDLYAVELTAGKQYQFDLKGLSSDNGTLPNPFLQLYGTDGMTQVAVNNDSGTGYDASITYSAGLSGVYYLRARHVSTKQGSYTVSAAELGVAPEQGFSPQSTDIEAGAAVTGTISARYEKDWYKIALAPGTYYRIDLKGRSSAKGTLSNPFVNVFDENGSVLKKNDNSGTGYDAKILFHSGAGGTYYLRALHAGSGTGSYELSSTAMSQDVELPVGGSVAGNIATGGERDWYKVTLQSGKHYQFDMRGKHSGGGTLGNAHLSIFDGDGNRLAYNDNGGVLYDARLGYHATRTGTYYVQAQHATGKTGTYTLSTAETDSDSVLALGGQLTGDISKRYESDWVRVSLDAGTSYQFDLKGRSSGGGTLYDPLLNIYDADMKHLLKDNNSGEVRDSRINFKAVESGDYFLRIRHNSSGTGSYTLTSSAGSDDHGDTADTSSVMAIGTVVEGDINSLNDKDLFKVSLQDGVSYRFDMTTNGNAIFEKQLNNPFLQIMGNDGMSVLASNDNGGTGYNAAMYFTPTADGNYYLSAQHSGTAQGSYRLYSSLALPA